MPYGALYSATKHAVEGYSESLDHELKTQGIRVSIIEPAYVNTSIDANLQKADAQLPEYDFIREKLHDEFQQSIQNSESQIIVAKTILKAITDSNPRIRYTPGYMASRLKVLRRFAPSKIVDTAIRKELKI